MNYLSQPTFGNAFAAVLAILFFALLVFFFVANLDLKDSIVAALVVQAMNSTKDIVLLSVKAVYGVTNESKGPP